MPASVKVLGQLAPTGATLQTLLTVPAAHSMVASTLSACNRSNTATTIRVAVRPAGAAIANQHWTFYDLTLPGNDTFVATIGWTLAATDVVSVQAASDNVSFTIFGEDIG
jgi:hypothetical protein